VRKVENLAEIFTCFFMGIFISIEQTKIAVSIPQNKTSFPSEGEVPLY